MKWVLATNNQHKLQEVQSFFRERLFQDNKSKLELLSLKDIGYNSDILETGVTFRENALIKAKTIAEKIKHPVLSDDSGLMVESLDGKPGVFSARYAGKDATDIQNNLKLLEELKGSTNRLAYFCCILCFIFPKQEPLFFEGYCYGSIQTELVGKNGFGYDPLFVPNGYKESFSSLGPKVKEKVSHRTKALNNLVDNISSNLSFIT